jgi:ribose 5-phosphate isomerase B
MSLVALGSVIGGEERTMRIGLGSDHLGFRLKEHLRRHLALRGHDVHDFGVFSEEPADYPDIAFAVADAVRRGAIERGILVCGTGLGMAIAANKVPGIFAAPVTDLATARLARESNDAQIITLGANIVGADLARELVLTWLAAEFRGGASGRKVAKIRALEQRCRSLGVHLSPPGGPPC